VASTERGALVGMYPVIGDKLVMMCSPVEMRTGKGLPGSSREMETLQGKVTGKAVPE
jgi:hypothetical protein